MSSHARRMRRARERQERRDGQGRVPIGHDGVRVIRGLADLVDPVIARELGQLGGHSASDYRKGIRELVSVGWLVPMVYHDDEAIGFNPDTGETEDGAMSYGYATVDTDGNLRDVMSVDARTGETALFPAGPGWYRIGTQFWLDRISGEDR